MGVGGPLGPRTSSREPGDRQKAGDGGSQGAVATFRHWAFTVRAAGRQRGFQDPFTFFKNCFGRSAENE